MSKIKYSSKSSCLLEYTETKNNYETLCNVSFWVLSINLDVDLLTTK